MLRSTSVISWIGAVQILANMEANASKLGTNLNVNAKMVTVVPFAILPSIHLPAKNTDRFDVQTRVSCTISIVNYNKAGYTATPVTCGWAGVVGSKNKKHS